MQEHSLVTSSIDVFNNVSNPACIHGVEFVIWFWVVFTLMELDFCPASRTGLVVLRFQGGRIANSAKSADAGLCLNASESPAFRPWSPR